MPDPDPPDTEPNVDDLVASLWIRLIKHKRYPEAVLASLVSYLEMRDPGKEERKNQAVWMMVTAANELQKQLRGEDTPVGAKPLACSFCGKHKPKAQLVAGPNAFICDECVVLATEILRHEQGKASPVTDSAD